MGPEAAGGEGSASHGHGTVPATGNGGLASQAVTSPPLCGEISQMFVCLPGPSREHLYSNRNRNRSGNAPARAHCVHCVHCVLLQARRRIKPRAGMARCGRRRSTRRDTSGPRLPLGSSSRFDTAGGADTAPVIGGHCPVFCHRFRKVGLGGTGYFYVLGNIGNRRLPINQVVFASTTNQQCCTPQQLVLCMYV